MKIDCFCFVEQLLKPGESMNMPVTFFIDPDIYKDENVKEVNEITLSYTFMKSMDQSLIDGNKLWVLVKEKLWVAITTLIT